MASNKGMASAVAKTRRAYFQSERIFLDHFLVYFMIFLCFIMLIFSLSVFLCVRLYLYHYVRKQMTKVHLQADSFIEFVSHKSLIWSVVLRYPGV